MNIHLLDDTGRNAAQIAHESGQKLILGYLALAESCFQLAQQLLQIKNIVKEDKEVQTEPLQNAKSEVLENFESTPNAKRTKPVEDDVDEEMIEILKQGTTLSKPPSLSPISNSDRFSNLSPTSVSIENRNTDSRCYSASFLYADSILSEVPNCSNDYCRTFLDHSSIRGSAIPASIAGSNIGDIPRRMVSSPTVSNCTNEPQIESKSAMRARMARVSASLGPKLVSPKRTLGSGPVLVGKLEPVDENEPSISSTNSRHHSRIDSTISTSDASVTLRRKPKVRRVRGKIGALS